MPGRQYNQPVNEVRTFGSTQVNGHTVPTDLVLYDRHGTASTTKYVAAHSIMMLEGFDSENDEFEGTIGESNYDGSGNQSITLNSADAGYRYGFNGKENDNEVKGTGNQQDYGMRIYDPRLGKFLSVDPLQNQYPYFTPYQFAGNTPVQASDIDGKEPEFQILKALEKRFLGSNYLERVENGAVQRGITTIKDGIHAYKQILGNQEVTTALGGTSYAKKLNGENTFGNKGLLELDNGPSIKELSKAFFNEYKSLFTNALKGNPEAIGGALFEVGMFFFPVGEDFKLASGSAKFVKSSGFAFVQEGKGFMNPAAREFEQATVGAMSDITSGKKFAPSLFFDNPGGRNIIKFDGFEIVGDQLLLIDAKLDVGTWSKQIKDLQRMGNALKQNKTFGKLNVRGVIEVPSEAASKNANRALEKAGVNNIEVRIRAKE